MVDSKTEVIRIDRDHLLKLWPVLYAAFDAWAENSNGETTAADLVQGALDGRKQTWGVWRGEMLCCALTRVTEDRVKVVELTHAAGKNPEDWQGVLLDGIEKWAAEIGAKRVRAIIRPGFTPFFRGRGYRERTREVERDIG